MAKDSYSSLINKIIQVLTKDRDKLIFTELIRGGDHGRIDLKRGELHQSALELSTHLRKKIEPGSKVLVCCEHGVSFVVTLIACIYSKLSIIPVSVPDSPQNVYRFSSIYSSSNPQFVLCTDRTIKKCNQIDEVVKESIINTSEFRNRRNSDIEVESQELDIHSETENNYSKEYPVIIQFSSGSTGHPKGYLISGAQILTGAEESYTLGKMTEEDIFVTWLPHYHDMGLFVHILFPLLSGLYVVSMAPFDFIQKPERWLRVISQFKGTCSGGAPFALSILNDRYDPELYDDIDLTSWKFVFSGSDFTPRKVLDDFRNNFKKHGLDPFAVFETYGLAENTVYVCGNRLDYAHPEIRNDLTTNNLAEGCLIQPEMVTSIKIIKDDRLKLSSSDRSGRIAISSPSLSNEYIYDGKLYPLDKIDGYYLTPDYGFIKDSKLFVTGRIEELIVVNGKNFNQSDILNQASTCFSDLNALAGCCFTNENTGLLTILIELKGKKSPTISYSELEVSIKNHIFKIYGLVVEHVKVLNRGELERTSSGKIRRKVMSSSFNSVDQHHSENETK